MKKIIKFIAFTLFITALFFVTNNSSKADKPPEAECANGTTTAPDNQVMVCPSPCTWIDGHKASHWTNC